MTQRASDYQAAELVLIAVSLARAGASATLIEQMTQFGVRWIRKTIRENGGVLALKSHDPRWFERDPQRLLQAMFFLMAYQLQPANDLPGRRLVDAYCAYRAFVRQGALDINKCAQVVNLYESREAWLRNCSECRISHLVLSERALCPICRLIERSFCRGCSRPLGSDPARPRSYCSQCSSRSARLARKRQVPRMASRFHISAPSAQIRHTPMGEPLRAVAGASQP